jgi:hypothetical protein
LQVESQRDHALAYTTTAADKELCQDCVAQDYQHCMAVLVVCSSLSFLGAFLHPFFVLPSVALHESITLGLTLVCATSREEGSAFLW